MKRFFKIALCLTLTLITLGFTMGGSCKSLYFDYKPPEVEWDGRFLYHTSAGDCYILGTEPELGVKSEVLDKLYLPSHYKGCRIDGFFLTVGGYVESLDNVEYYTFGIDITPVKELYQPYNYITDIFLGEENYGKLFCPNTEFELMSHIMYRSTNAETLTVYIPATIFIYVYNVMRSRKNITINLEQSFGVCYQVESIEQIKYIYKANTAYMFNYEGSPNEGYYFINDFERGGLIENTPYEPFREGYGFTGWYKDAECTQKWNFEVDTLPEPTYDENGELEYVETRLYAGWNKI